MNTCNHGSKGVGRVIVRVQKPPTNIGEEETDLVLKQLKQPPLLCPQLHLQMRRLPWKHSPFEPSLY